MNYSKIKIYSTTTCPYCRLETAWLTANHIPFEEVHVDRNPQEAQAMVDKTGQMGVPVTEIQYPDRKPEYIIGFDQATLRYMLGI